MVDFHKAFEFVDHNLLLQKLRLYKYDENSLSWLNSYLSNRTQMVSINNKVSSSEPIKFEVPQGPILGPLMFLIFINDLPLVLANTITSTDLYADDTTVYDIQTNIADIRKKSPKLTSFAK